MKIHQHQIASQARVASPVSSWLTSPRRVGGLSLLLILLLLIGLPFYFQASAASGDLDPTFGTGGRVLTDFVADAQHFSSADTVALVIQPDGKLIDVGSRTLTGQSGFQQARTYCWCATILTVPSITPSAQEARSFLALG